VTIAERLHADQRYEAAHSWYHRVFNPMAAESIPDDLDPEERARRERDRVWRYLELRGLDLPTLRQILTQPEAIEAPYRPCSARARWQ